MKKEKQEAKIQKYCSAINEINRLIIKGNYDSRDIKSILFKHKASLTAFSFAVKAGLFTTVSRGVFKSNYNIIEPFQIRKLDDLVKKYNCGRTRVKNNYNKSNTILNYNLLNENEAISFLKQLGYKIMKPINQYEEV
jgi:hypothetical protein